MNKNKIAKCFCISFLILCCQSFAEDHEAGGGYDYKAVEKTEADAAAKALANKKAKALKAKKLRQEKLIANEKASLLPENLAKLSDVNLCIKAGKYREKPELKLILVEARVRSLSYDESSIKQKNIKIGGYECDVFASYGKPERYNRTVNKHGTRVQMVYGYSYIYTENGVITAWSD